MSDEAQPRMLSRLESLPGELRNRIYRYAVVQEEPVLPVLVEWSPKRNFASIRYCKEPALAHSCDQIRDEVLSIFYSENTFNFATIESGLQGNLTEEAKIWLRSTGKYSSKITSIAMSYCIENALEEGKTEECIITATVSTLGSPIFRLSGELNGYCECHLREAERMEVKESDRVAQLSAVVVCMKNFLFGTCVFMPHCCSTCGKACAPGRDMS